MTVDAFSDIYPALGRIASGRLRSAALAASLALVLVLALSPRPACADDAFASLESAAAVAASPPAGRPADADRARAGGAEPPISLAEAIDAATRDNPGLSIDRRAIVIDKSARTLTLEIDGSAVKRYPCVFGGVPGDKQREGDHRTPEGLFFVARKRAPHRFHCFLDISYPGAAHARRALDRGLVSPVVYRRILDAEQRKDGSLWADPANVSLWAPLGGLIGIHGLGLRLSGAPLTDENLGHDIRKAGDWTEGCVALLNGHVDEVFAFARPGTPVRIVAGPGR
ncbi:MAG: L,D-transpeptidase [Candidatus Riflebacteria bacterium]|nr:L,D-transpeptidase [Candidatus Riflebacteria bacterium]